MPIERPRLQAIYIRNKDAVKNLEEAKLAKENFEEFSINQRIYEQSIKAQLLNNNENDLTSEAVLKTLPKPQFKGKNKTYPNYKEKKENKGLRQSLFQTLGFTSSSTKDVIQPKLDKEQPVYFHSSTRVSEGFSNNINLIQNSKVPMNLDSFLGQFSNERDMENLDLNQILDMDNEKLIELKEKALNFIDATSNILSDQHNKDKENLEVEDCVMFFAEKLQELKSNDINIQIFIQNIERVKGISYEKNGAKIFFKRD